MGRFQDEEQPRPVRIVHQWHFTQACLMAEAQLEAALGGPPYPTEPRLESRVNIPRVVEAVSRKCQAEKTGPQYGYLYIVMRNAWVKAYPDEEGDRPRYITSPREAEDRVVQAVLAHWSSVMTGDGLPNVIRSLPDEVEGFACKQFVAELPETCFPRGRNMADHIRCARKVRELATAAFRLHLEREGQPERVVRADPPF